MNPATPHTMVALYESNAGDLFIAADDEEVAYNLTNGDDAGFYLDAEMGVLGGERDDWTVASYPLAEITVSLGQTNGTRLIAIYDGTTGEVTALRGTGGRILAGHNGRRYIGHLEGEE